MTRSRTALAGGLAFVAFVALVGGWLVSGWSAARTEERALLARADQEATRISGELAAALDVRLEELRRREAARPYFHYQPLFHDPRGAAEGNAVAPSPLASGPNDPLVRAHFQIDAAGKVSMPTIAEPAPELSNPATLEADRALLADLRAAGSRLFAAPAHGEVRVAQAELEQQQRYRPQRANNPPEPAASVILELDNQIYTQNARPFDVYNTNKNLPATPLAQAPKGTAQIVVRPLEWRAISVGGERTLALVRSVRTPDGELQQGMLLSRAAVADWIAERSEEPTRLVPAGEAGARALAAGELAVAVDAAPARERAATEAAGVRRSFLLRFVPISLLAAVCGALIVALVARAERLARERAAFAAAAAHELRTPLASLELYAEMLSQDLGDPTKRDDYARRVGEEAARLGRVVSNVLGFAQLERGTIAVAPREGDVVERVRAVVERARPALERAGVVLEVRAETARARIQEHTALMARFDDDALARALENLLDNAEKHGRGAADRSVDVEVRRDGAEIEIAVIDRGPGVPRKHRLFEVFWRGGGRDAAAGLGLGLSLSRSLVRSMGGDLVHRSTPGGGATFALRLPAA